MKVTSQEAVVRTKTITLVLDQEEAEVLRALCGNVAGCGKIRKITNNFWSHLAAQGVDSPDLFDEVILIKRGLQKD